METKKYKIPVNFTITYTMEVEEEDEAGAKELAENKAIDEFYEDLNRGLIGGGDFAYEAQDPIEL